MAGLQGKAAIVTGASKGMGRHFARVLVEQGVKVAALARPSVQLDSLTAELGEDVLPIACDVTQSGAVSAAVSQTVATFGRLDFLINNAAIYSPFLLEQADDAIVERHFATNVLAPIWLIRAAIPHLRKTSGQIVSVSSESVSHPFPMLSVYAASKAALETLSSGLRDELRADGIRVSVLRSGSVSGGSGGESWSAEAAKAFYDKIIETGHAQFAGEAATPESMAQALLAVLTLPPDVSADLIEVRAARAGVPDRPEKAQ